MDILRKGYKKEVMLVALPLNLNLCTTFDGF